MSDERDRAGSAGAGSDPGTENPRDGQTAVVTPARPTGTRSRRGAADDDGGEAVDLATGTKAAPTKNGSAKKTAKRGADGPGRNPFTYVWTFLSQVVAELRKVIWPNRKQMVTYTIVVLIFLAFMVALIGLTDMGVGRLVSLLLGN